MPGSLLPTVPARPTRVAPGDRRSERRGLAAGISVNRSLRIARDTSSSSDFGSSTWIVGETRVVLESERYLSGDDEGGVGYNRRPFQLQAGGNDRAGYVFRNLQ